MEESFPRGGTQKVSEEKEVAKRPREDDNLFSTHHEEEETMAKKKKKVEKPQPAQEEKRFASKLKVLELLSYKDLSVGMLFLGCITDVKDFELVVALPYGLTGYIQVTNICEAYTKMLNKQVTQDEPLEGLLPLPSLFTPGMLVRCVISNLEKTSGGFNSIKLSLNPKVINEDLTSSSLNKGMSLTGFVTSVEDHGYLIDLGIAGTKAFLPKQKAQAYLKQANKGASLNIGQYLNCVIEEVKNKGRICHLSIAQSDVGAAIATDEQQWTLNNLLPGLVVKAQIQKVCLDHVTLSFLSSYSGVVDFLHFDPKKANSYQKDQMVKACILWIDRATKYIRLTLCKTFLQPGNPVQQVTSSMIGSVQENCTVKAVYKNVGAVFTVDGDTLGFAFKRNLVTGESSIMSKFKEGTAHTGRVIGFSPMDGIHLLTFMEKHVKGLYLRHEDVQAGQIVEGTINSIEAKGMVVNITQHLNGLVPKLHLADVTLQHPEKKYSPGKKIKCRVLNVNPSEKKLILTCKKTMIESKLPIIASFHDARPGMVTHGFIWAVKDVGCIVKFYNDVHGLAPIRELSSEFIPSPHGIFYKGQVIKMRVLECNPEMQSLVLSFKMSEVHENVGRKEKEQKRPIKEMIPEQEPGKMVSVRIVDKTDAALDVVILPEETPAVLPSFTLSDHVTNCELLFHNLKEGDVLYDVMCLKSLQDKAQVSEKFVTDIREHVVEGKTVIAKVTDIDGEKKRFLLTLKMAECASQDAPAESAWRIAQYFSELQFAKDLMKRNGKPEDAEETILSLEAGNKVKLVVEEVNENGVIEFACSTISGAHRISAVQREDEGKHVSPGQKVTATVVHVDLLKLHVHVSLEDTLLKKSNKAFAEGSVLPATVQHLAEEFAVVSLENTSQLAAIPLSCRSNDAFQFQSEKLSLGQKISVRLLSSDGGKHGLLLAVQNAKKGKAKVPVNIEGSKPAVGQVVTGTVKKVKPTCVLLSVDGTKAGIIHSSQIMEDVPLGSIPTSRLKNQQSVTCRVIGHTQTMKSHKFLPFSCPNMRKSFFELSILPRPQVSRAKGDKASSTFSFGLLDGSVKIPKFKSLNMYSPGDKVTCYVYMYNKEKQCLEVDVAPGVRGQVEKLLIATIPKVLKRPEKHFKPGVALSATVVNVAPTWLNLSLTDGHNLSEGLVTIGCVKQVVPCSGVVLDLPCKKTGRVDPCQLDDCYARAAVKEFNVGAFVRCCVLSVGKKEVRLSMRKSRINSNDAGKVNDEDLPSIDALQEGQLVNGFVSGLTDKGLFVRISSAISGFVRFKNLSCYYVQDTKTLEQYLPLGKLLTAKVIAIDKEKQQIYLSLLPEDTGKPDVIPKSAGFDSRFGCNTQEEEKQISRKKRKAKGAKDNEDKEQSPKKRRKREDANDTEDSGVDLNSHEKDENEKMSSKKKRKIKEAKNNAENGQETETKKKEKTEIKNTTSVKAPAQRLQVSSGFSWDVSLNTLKTSLNDKEESSSDMEEDEEQELSKVQQAFNKLKGQAAEKQTPRKETAPLGQQPQSVNEFERLVLTSPNNSAHWIQYMDFHLQATELEQARAVAERALQTIYFREEQEKLNVWAAMLKMENTYGTEETLMKTFERAVQYNDPLKAFQHLVDIYIQAEKNKEADELFNTMVKRFRQEKSVYWKYGQYLLKQGQSEAAHRLLQRALKCLPEKEHVDVISKFGQLEFRMGDPVRAKALFESTLSSYPKRTDIWSVYIDMMVKHGSQKEIRDIFERVIHLSLAAKKIKFFFKRYLDYEKTHGTEKTVQAVKEKALKYVESKGSMDTS
ncbi:LOW QUALITY PROTEIN: protein RRP5 homolog [Gastrophryne carolinensis]